MKFIKNLFNRVVNFFRKLAEMKAETKRMEEQAKADIAAMKEETDRIVARAEENIAALNEKDLENRKMHFTMMKILTLAAAFHFPYAEATAANAAGDSATLNRILAQMEAKTYVEQPYVNPVVNELVQEPAQPSNKKVVKMRKPQRKTRR